MSTISGYDSSSISTLFSSLSTSSSSSNSSSSSSFGIDLATYNQIRNGSYFKLVKAYYSTDTGKASISSSTSTSADTAKTLTSVKSSTEDLSESAENLYKSNSSVFKKVTTKDEDGNETTDYDRDAIYKAVNQFVSDYNSVISTTGKSNTSSIANAAASMVNNTASNSSLLGKVGIKIDSEDYTLSIDKDTFMDADISNIKSLFNGNGSFAYATAVKSSMINSYANLESSKSNTYNSSGNYTYNYSTGELYSSTF